MRKILLTLLGLILLIILAYFCFENKRDTIRDDLITRTQSALVANEFDWAKADIKGESLTMTNIIELSGTAPTENAKIDAQKLALGILGVGGVDNHLIVTQEYTSNKEQDSAVKDSDKILPTQSIKEDKQESTSPIAPQPVANPNKKTYKIYMVKNAKGKVLLDGYVNNDEQLHKLVEHANKLFGKDNIVNNLTIKQSAPKDWIYISEFALDKLNEVDYGDMNITNNSYIFNAHLPTNDKKLDFLNSIREVMSDPENHYGRYRGDYIVTAPVAEAVIPSAIQNNKNTSCQKALDKAINSRKILFAYDKADIQNNSYKILDDIVTALKSCDLNSLGILEIDGHTDSIGSSIYNKKLSQKRADRIKAYLIKKGFSSAKIKAVGYGESKPIASNTTEAGRAKNRRTEFIVKGVK